MDLRNAVYALGLKGAVINTGAVACLFQCAVCVLGPLFAPLLQKLLVVPSAVFLAEALRANIAHGQKDVAVRVFVLGAVNGNIRHHANACKLLSDKAAHKLKLLFFAQLDRQGHFDFSANLGIFAFLGFFNHVPKISSR